VFREFSVLFGVKAEQLRRAVACRHLGLFQWHEQAKAQNLFAEIPLV